MMKEKSTGKYGSSSQKSMKEKEKHLLDKIQGIFINLQIARKESRANDMVIFEEQMHQLLREWNAELVSPATSLAVCLSILIHSSNNICVFSPSCKEIWIIYIFICWLLKDGSLGSLPGELAQLLQESEEKDDATSPLTKLGLLNTDFHPNNISDMFFQEVSFFHLLWRLLYISVACFFVVWKGQC